MYALSNNFSSAPPNLPDLQDGICSVSFGGPAVMTLGKVQRSDGHAPALPAGEAEEQVLRWHGSMAVVPLMSNVLVDCSSPLVQRP